jgi:type VI secretion system protein VasJ
MSEPWTPERLRALVTPLLAPISDEKPGGVNAKAEKAYDVVAAEVAKLDSPSGGAIDWKVVVAEGRGLLTTKSKDLFITCYVAFALAKTKGLGGLLEGLATLWGIVSDFWETAFPEVTRLRGRANAISWLIDRVDVLLGSAQVTANDRETVEGLAFVGGLLHSLVRERLANQAPALGPLTEGIDRLASSLPPIRPPEPTPPTPPPASSPSAKAPAPPPAPPPVQIGPHILLPLDNDDIPTRLAFVGKAADALVNVAKALRAARVDDPLAYRLVRTALWLSMAQAPAADDDGKTQLEPLPAQLFGELETLEAREAWHDLLRASETALLKHPLALCLQRFAVRALAELNLVPARLAVVAEVRGL